MFEVTAQFIDESFLTSRTPINANIDIKLIAPFILTAQDQRIQPILGTALYVRLMDGIANSNLTPNEEKLIRICQPALAYWTLHTAIPFIGIEIRGAGVVRPTNEKIQPATVTEMGLLQNESKNIAEFYSQRIQDWLCQNPTMYPEYTVAQTSIKPIKPTFDGGIYYGSQNKFDPTFYSNEDEIGCC